MTSKLDLDSTVNADIVWRSLFLSERRALAGESDPSSELPPAYEAKLRKLRSRSNPRNQAVVSYLDELERMASISPASISIPGLSWLPEFFEAIAFPVDASFLDCFNADTRSEFEAIPFAPALMPFAQFYQKRLRDLLTLKGIDVQETLLGDFCYWHTRELSTIAGLTLYCEYRDQVDAPSPSAYDEWSKNIARSGWDDLITRFPLLGRFLVQRSHHLMSSLVEILERYERDKDELVSRGMIDDLKSKIVHIDLVLSDFHKNGRAVSRLMLSSEESLIYKPKSLANDTWFFETFARSEGSVFTYIKTLNRHDYGWVEDITDKVQESTPQGHKNSLARAAGLAYLLNTTDLHPENIVADDDGVFLIDLETILNGTVPSDYKRPDEDRWKVLSVLNTEIFKSHFSTEERDGPSANEQDYHLDLQSPVYFFTLCDSDGVRMEILGKKKEGEKGNQSEVPAYEFSDRFLDLDVQAVKQAFISSCSGYQKDLLKEKVWETIPRDMICRLVPRPTSFYARIFQRIYHPFCLKDAGLVSLDLSDLILTLNESGAETAKKWVSLVKDELRQLENGDIPYFWHNVHGKDLYSPNGMVCADFMALDSVTLLREKIINSDKTAISNQALLIDASLTMSVEQLSEDRRLSHNSKNIEQSSQPARAGKACMAFGVCADIAARIIESANTYDDHDVRWIAYQPEQTGSSVIPTINDVSYYSGYWGIVLYLHAFERVALKQEVAGGGASEVSAFLDKLASYWSGHSQSLFMAPGLLSQPGVGGLAGQLKALHSIMTLSPQRWSVLQAEIELMIGKAEDDLIKKLSGAVVSMERDKNLYDYLWGWCGLLPVLCEMKELPELSEAAHKSIHFIIETTAQSLRDNLPEYLGGKISSPWADPPLAGFAHGNAGVISTIAAYIKYKNHQKDFSDYSGWVSLIQALLDHDDIGRDPETGLWLDRRHKISEKILVNKSWCHGLAGIGNSRLDLLDIPELRDQARRDLEVVLRHFQTSSGMSHSDFFCCGIAGEIDFLSRAGQRLDIKEICEQAQMTAHELAGRISETQKFHSFVGNASFRRCPGLFQGAAGVGYILVKTKHPELPSLV